MLLDVGRWAQEGWIDEIVAAGYYREGGTPEGAHGHLRELTQDRCRVWLYWWVPNSMDDFRQSVETAQSLGAPQILYWESDYIDPPGQKAFAEQMTQEWKARSA
jgi:hypothetical protein